MRLVTKIKNVRICLQLSIIIITGLYSASLLLIYPMSLSAEILSQLFHKGVHGKDRRGLGPSSASCIQRVKRKAYKINAKIEDVGLTEH